MFWNQTVCLLQHFRGRKNRCYSLAVRAVRRAFVYASKARKAKRRSMRQVGGVSCDLTPVSHSDWALMCVCVRVCAPQLWIQRVAAASREQHMKYPALIHNLLKVSVTTVRWFPARVCVCADRVFVLTVQRGAEQTCAVWPVHHRAALLPVPDRTGPRAPDRGPQSRAGGRGGAAGSLLSHHTAAVNQPITAQLTMWPAERLSGAVPVNKCHLCVCLWTSLKLFHM